jgi:beta-xylosidase
MQYNSKRDCILESVRLVRDRASMYKIEENNYIFVTRPANTEYVLKASSPWGPYERKALVESISGPIPNAGYAHQGGVVETKDGNWYNVAFMDVYPGGRILVVAPLKWTSDDWPQVQKINNTWEKT